MLRSHKELIVWQKAVNLVTELYRESRGLPREELYGLTSQMRRAAVSIPSNISEGKQRKNKREFLQFLRIAYGSAAELETQLLIAGNIYAYVPFVASSSLLDEVQRMLNVMIRKLEASS